MSAFFLMGGYAFYVWSAYVVTTITLVVSYMLIKKHEKSQLQRLLEAQN